MRCHHKQIKKLSDSEICENHNDNQAKNEKNKDGTASGVVRKIHVKRKRQPNITDMFLKQSNITRNSQIRILRSDKM